VIYCNIGNPQELKQKPLTFFRQVISLLEYPELLEQPEVLKHYPADVVARAREFLSKHPHGTGAYSQSPGIPFIRQAVADFIARRDGVPSSRDQVILTDGASKGAQAVLLALQKSPSDGFMIPVPQYPLYSATISLNGGHQVRYFLDEQNGWQLSEQILTESYDRARKEGVRPVLIAVINPGNPTGAVLSRENITMVIRFARERGMAIIADEVYQENVYVAGKTFVSFAKVMHEIGETGVSLFSLHSVSKGFLGECGHRGGYLEIRNVPPDVLAQFIKQQSISLCANVPGQIATWLMVDPPRDGEPSQELYRREKQTVLTSLKKRAEILEKGIKGIKGMYLEMPQGAMYAFVRFELPAEQGKNGGGTHPATMSPAERAAYEARRDTDYCMALLEETGICVVPGSGFGQLPGTLHFRTTFLPPQDEIEVMVEKLRVFHERYVHKLETA
jgi:aspartate/methionine/tyrosine aminotransferase